MKAWRLEAEKINKRRKAGSREATARVQKGQRALTPKTVGYSNWLLSGLMIHAGFWPASHAYQKPEPYIPYTEGFIKRMLKKAKRWWNS